MTAWLTKYVGGKRQLAPTLAALIPDPIERYIEPFCGSAALYFHLWDEKRVTQATTRVLADLDDDLIQLYTAVRDDPEALRVNIQTLIDYAPRFGGTESLFEHLRHAWNLNDRSPSRNVFLRAMSFNGLWRVAKGTGYINMPWNKGHDVEIHALDRISDCHQALAGVALMSTGYATWTRAAVGGKRLMGPGAVAFVDPPYMGGFAEYTAAGFSTEDQFSLLKTCAEWSDLGAFVIYTNSIDAADFVRSYWPGAKMRKAEESRVINSDGDGRGPAPTIVVTSR